MPEAAKKELTAADVAKLVKRVVRVEKDGEVVEKEVAVAAREVLAFRDYGTHVVVVTTDGQKLTNKAE